MTRAQKQKQDQIQLQTYIGKKNQVQNDLKKDQGKCSKTKQSKSPSEKSANDKVERQQKEKSQTTAKKGESDNLLNSDKDKLIELQNRDATLVQPRQIHIVVEQTKVKDHGT